EMLVVPFTSGFGSDGRRAGPQALASAIGGKQDVLELLADAPVEQVLADGLPRIERAVAERERPGAIVGECTLVPPLLAAAGARRRTHPAGAAAGGAAWARGSSPSRRGAPSPPGGRPRTAPRRSPRPEPPWSERATSTRASRPRSTAPTWSSATTSPARSR